MLKIEIYMYIFIALVLCSLRRVISGMKNGCYYSKYSVYATPLLDKYKKNLHFLETPAWYTQFGCLFLLLLSVFRLINPTYEFIPFMLKILYSIIVTMGCSGLANYHFQGYINHGSNLPFVDPDENPKSEFALGPINFWWIRPWCGNRRKYVPFIALIFMVIGLLLGLEIINI